MIIIVNFQLKQLERRSLKKNRTSTRFESATQRSKLTFSKSCLLATFNCKMVTIKKYSRQKKLEGEDTLWHITRKADVPNGMFSTLRFDTVRERERRDCLVAKTIYFYITKLLRRGNIANDAQKPSNRSNCPFWAAAHFKFTHLTFWTTRGEKRKTVDTATCTIH